MSTTYKSTNPTISSKLCSEILSDEMSRTTLANDSQHSTNVVGSCTRGRVFCRGSESFNFWPPTTYNHSPLDAREWTPTSTFVACPTNVELGDEYNSVSDVYPLSNDSWSLPCLDSSLSLLARTICRPGLFVAEASSVTDNFVVVFGKTLAPAASINSTTAGQNVGHDFSASHRTFNNADRPPVICRASDVNVERRSVDTSATSDSINSWLIDAGCCWHRAKSRTESRSKATTHRSIWKFVVHQCDLDNLSCRRTSRRELSSEQLSSLPP